ncbi:hypothetical protein [Nannocystis bainbridge]|uniref:Uncharacterized protein n=1 Tax=Nannocystis bainbridge TaxID=2995303 RepID=A0ABT5E544_9BACT|nr:hypothetical protein [Nannocystis bainbridge]MDC0720989.1 hypothetical protein [Nannocystis bainbridge]
MASPRILLAAASLVLACNDAGPAGASASATTGELTTSTTSTDTSTGGPLTTGGSLTTGDSEDGTTTTTTTGDPLPTSTSTTTGDDTTTGGLTRCPVVAPAAQVSIVADDDIHETSGLIASRTQTDVFWLHNDSGDGPRFFAIDPTGARLGAFEVDGAQAVDWEDMSSGPGPTAGEWLYFGDIGDNPESRQSITVYRVPEPDAAAAGGETVTIEGVEAIELTYPDEPHNAETLLVDPQTGDLVIVAKGDPTRIFRLPGPVAAGGPYVLEEVAPIQFPAVVATGGDISPAGDFIAVRTYGQAFLWLRLPGDSIADAFAGEPCTIPLAIETQGETLAIAPDASGYYTMSEGDAVPLWWYGFN